MNVQDGMTRVVLSIGPAHTLREAARLMSQHGVGAAVVIDPEHSGIGILTERDILDSVGAGQDADSELVADHRTPDVVFAAPELDAGAGRHGHGRRELPAPHRRRRRGGDWPAVHARHRALLVRSAARERGDGCGSGRDRLKV